MVESEPQELVGRLDLQSLQAVDTSGLGVLEQLNKAIVLRSDLLILAGLNAHPMAKVKQSGFLEKVEIL